MLLTPGALEQGHFSIWSIAIFLGAKQCLTIDEDVEVITCRRVPLLTEHGFLDSVPDPFFPKFTHHAKHF